MSPRRLTFATAALFLLGCSSPTMSTDAGPNIDATSDGTSVSTPDCGSCPIWSVRCGDRCVDPTSNPENCGACGVRCDGQNQICQGGVCVTAPRCAAIDGGTTSGPGLRGEYYSGMDLSMMVFARVDPNVNFDWTMTPPDPRLMADHYSVQWTGQLTVATSDGYTFITDSDDGVRLWVDGVLLIDDWTDHGLTEDTGTITLMSGQPHDLLLQYFQETGGATIKLSWSSPSLPRQVIPSSQLQTTADADFTCAGGLCCGTGTGTPVCCPAGMRCVLTPEFSGCCPNTDVCGTAPVCAGH